MTKTIYVARSDRHHGDSFDLYVGYDREEAETALWITTSHMTAKELAASDNYIDERTVEVGEDETAQEAYDRLLDEGEWY